jgi:hypothetical protein
MAAPIRSGALTSPEAMIRMNAFGGIIHENKACDDPTGLCRPVSPALSLAGVVLGCVVLNVTHRQRSGWVPSIFPWVFGFAGMLLGWVFDVAKADPIPLNPLCTSMAGTGFVQVLSLHFRTMPGMHVGMLVGGLFAVPHVTVKRLLDRRGLFSACAHYVLCSACMLAGMTAGALWLTRSWQAGAHAWPDILGTMCLGMTWGMVASVGLCRALTGRHPAGKSS